MCQAVESIERLIYKIITASSWDFPGSPLVKPLRFTAGDTGSIPDQGIKIKKKKAKQLPSCHTIMYVLTQATENRFSFSDELLVLIVFCVFFFFLFITSLETLLCSIKN